MILKRSIATILILISAISLLNFQGIAESAPAKTNLYEEEVTLLRKIGISALKFESDLNFTKAEFAELILKTYYPNINLSKGSESETFPFADVKQDHPNYFHIRVGKELGVITGDAEKKFYPDREITISEAIVILINALGYPAFARVRGGYPFGYYMVAKEIGIIKSIDLSWSAPLSGSQAAKMIYQSLLSEIVSVKGIQNGEITVEVNKGKTVLTERFGISEYDAILIDNGISSLVGAEAKNPERLILEDRKSGNRLTVYSDDPDVRGNLGARIKAYVKNNEDTGRNEMIHYCLHPGSKQILINAKRLVDINSNYLEYEETEHNGKSRRINYQLNNTVIIFNGVHLLEYDISQLRPKDGFIKLTDHNGDGIYEVMEIINFNYHAGSYSGPARNIVVDTFEKSESSYISCIFNPLMSLDLKSDEADYLFIMNSDKKEITDLKQYDVISVAEAPRQIAGKTFYLLAVSNEVTNGAIDSIGKDEITVKNQTYLISDSFLSIKSESLKNLDLKGDILLMMDVTGKAAYLLSDAALKEYGYLITGRIISKADEMVVVKLFNRYGKVKTYELASKVIIDGNSKNTPKDQLHALQLRPSYLSKPKDAPADDEYMSRPIIFETDSEDRIIRIDTDTPNKPILANTPITNQYKDQTLIRYSDEEAVDDKALKAAFRSHRLTRLRNTVGAMEGRFYIRSNTIIMSVPDIDTNGLGGDFNSILSENKSMQPVNYKMVQLYEKEINDSNYKILHLSGINPNFAYDMQAYDIDPVTKVAGLVVLRGRTDVYYYGAVSTTAPMSIFLRKTEVFDETKGKKAIKLYHTQNGMNENSVLVDQEDLYFPYYALIFGCEAAFTPYGVPVTELRKGDIIRVISADGYLSHIERVYKLNTIKDSYSLNLFPSTPPTYYDTNKGANIPFPFDERQYWAGHYQSYTLTTLLAKSVHGNIIEGYLGLNSASAINPDDGKTYVDQTHDLSKVTPVLINITKNNGVTDIKVSSGTLKDIVTGDIDQASLLVIKRTVYTYNTLFIINGLHNL